MYMDMVCSFFNKYQWYWLGRQKPWSILHWSRFAKKYKEKLWLHTLGVWRNWSINLRKSSTFTLLRPQTSYTPQLHWDPVQITHSLSHTWHQVHTRPVHHISAQQTALCIWAFGESENLTWKSKANILVKTQKMEPNLKVSQITEQGKTILNLWPFQYRPLTNQNNQRRGKCDFSNDFSALHKNVKVYDFWATSCTKRHWLSQKLTHQPAKTNSHHISRFTQ